MTGATDRFATTKPSPRTPLRERGPGRGFFLRATLALLFCNLSITGCNDQPPQPGPTIDNPPATINTADNPDTADTPDTQHAPPPVATARILDKTFDDLKFDIEPDAPFDQSLLTDEIEELFGKRIRIRGYILPTFQRTGIQQFILVRDNLECCFGPGAALFDCIVVDMAPGKSTDFSVRPIAVEGKFTLEELIGPEGNHLAIFHLEGEKVK